MTLAAYPGKVGLQQRVLPSYRTLFIDTLAKSCQGGLSVFAGKPLNNEGIDPASGFQVARLAEAKNHYFGDPASPVFLCWQGGFISWLEEYQPDILLVEANPRYLSTRRAITWMHHRGCKVIGWGLGAPPIAGNLAGLREWERMGFLHSLDALIAYSQLGAEQYRSLGLPESKVFVASNAVSDPPTNPPSERPASFIGQPVVVFVGRLQPRKRVDLLLQAAASLPAHLQPRVVIVGDGPARMDLEQISRQIYPQAEFVGARHGADVEPYLAGADLLVLPGTGGLAIQQAMGFALPVIVARGDGTQDDLVRPENGWQVPPDDLAALTHALQEALSDPNRLRQMGLASYRIVAQEINVNRMVDVFLQAMHFLSKKQG
jgi:glycosyltransferase involved in cell wall biosynthesis